MTHANECIGHWTNLRPRLSTYTFRTFINLYFQDVLKMYVSQNLFILLFCASGGPKLNTSGICRRMKLCTVTKNRFYIEGSNIENIIQRIEEIRNNICLKEEMYAVANPIGRLFAIENYIFHGYPLAAATTIQILCERKQLITIKLQMWIRGGKMQLQFLLPFMQ